MICPVNAIGKQLLCSVLCGLKLHLHGLFLCLSLVLSAPPTLRALSGTQILDSYKVSEMNMRYYINDVIDFSGLHLSQ